MALVNEVASSSAAGGGSTAQAPKGIHKTGSGFTSMYTVPAGRVFKGVITYSGNTYDEIARINDVGLYVGTGQYAVYIDMASGDVFKSGSGNTYLHGVEQDA